MGRERLLAARAVGAAFGAAPRGVATPPVAMLRVLMIYGRLSLSEDQTFDFSGRLGPFFPLFSERAGG